MRLLELHLLQSFPVNCLNRDQFGSPKSALFGGAPRARISSQCWKRAIRLLAQSEAPAFDGKRTKAFIQEFVAAFLAAGLSQAEAEKAAKDVAGKIVAIDAKDGSSKNILYFSKGELAAAAKAFVETGDAKKKVDAATKALKAISRDGVDIAFFGRMVADTDLTLEGAALFSHSISTHKVSNDIDFFTAVDDLKPVDKTGADHIGDAEFNSACHYRYIGLNLDLLADSSHLAFLSLDERKAAVAAFLKASLLAIPNAKKNSMAAFSPIGFGLGLARQGQPISLANAFEKPIRSEDGLLDVSKTALLKHWDALKANFGVATDKALKFPEEAALDKFVKELADYAV